MIPLRDDDVMHPMVAGYREKAYYAFAIAGSLMLLPFAVHTLARGRYGVGAAALAVVLLYVVNAALVALRRAPAPRKPACSRTSSSPRSRTSCGRR